MHWLSRFGSTLDRRVVGLSTKGTPCAAHRLCEQCEKTTDTYCLLHRLFVLACLGFGVVALLPWCAPLRPYEVVSPVFYSQVVFSYETESQLIDFRLFTTLAAALMLAAAAVLAKGPARMPKARPLFFVAFGLMSFSLFRLVEVQAFHDDPVWFDFWEEMTELLFVVGLALLLYWARGPLGIGGRTKSG